MDENESTVTPEQIKNHIMIMALSSLITGFVGPLICWFIWKDTEPEIDTVGKPLINGLLSWTLYLILACIASGILMFILIGYLTLPLAFIAYYVVVIINVVKLIQGNKEAKMPLTFDFIK